MAHLKVPTFKEWLAVFVIVAVMILVMFPVFAPTHFPHSRFSCLSNEKQLGLAIVQYAQDNDQTLPRGTQGGGVGWCGQLYPYTKLTGIDQCPDDETMTTSPAVVVSYGYNRNAARHPRLKSYAAPQQTVLLFEVAGVTAQTTLPDEGASHGATSFSAAGDGTAATLAAGRAHAVYATRRHQGKSNFLFADGHAKALSSAQVSVGVNAVHAIDTASRGIAAGTKAQDAQGNPAYEATFSVK